jgi:hypothetical protein
MITYRSTPLPSHPAVDLYAYDGPLMLDVACEQTDPTSVADIVLRFYAAGRETPVYTFTYPMDSCYATQRFPEWAAMFRRLANTLAGSAPAQNPEPPAHFSAFLYDYERAHVAPQEASEIRANCSHLFVFESLGTGPWWTFIPVVSQAYCVEIHTPRLPPCPRQEWAGRFSTLVDLMEKHLADVKQRAEG